MSIGRYTDHFVLHIRVPSSAVTMTTLGTQSTTCPDYVEGSDQHFQFIFVFASSHDASSMFELDFLMSIDGLRFQARLPEGHYLD